MKLDENEVPEVITPSHKLWPMFRKKLDETVTIYRSGKLHNQCSGDLTITTGILESMTNIDVDETLIFFREHGGFCDCNVLLNVARTWNNK